MEKERRKSLIEYYKNCSDYDLEMMIQDGRESFEEGVYELILNEAEKRGLDEKSGNNFLNDEQEDFGPDNKYYDEINFSKMSTEDLLGLLINTHLLDELNFHLASAEAIRRNIDATDIREFKKIVQQEQCNKGAEIELIENPQPLVILKTIDEACLCANALNEEGILFEIQIIVDQKDYRKAEMASDRILSDSEDYQIADTEV